MKMTNIDLLPQKLNESAPFWKLANILLNIASVLALLSLWQGLYANPIYLNSQKVQGTLVIVLLSLAAFNSLIWRKREIELLQKIQNWLNRKKALSLLLAGFTAVALFFFLIGTREFHPLLNRYFVRLFFFFVASLLITILLHSATRVSIWQSFAISILGLAAISQLLSYIPHPLNNPFSINWSESSWYYYASFFYGQKLYGSDIPWPYLDIGRPFLLSFAYLLPNPSLVVMRIWQYLLWIGSAALVSCLLWRRLRPLSRPSTIILLLWGVLWILVGPTYMHLSLVTALVLWGFDSQRLGKSLFWIGLASILGGILRINWIPVPAKIGLTLYFLEQPLQDEETGFRYLKRPFWIGFTGLGIGVTSFMLYLQISGRTDTRVISKLSATFLWDRLLPNATLFTGILLGTFIVSVGLLAVIYLVWRKTGYHPLRFGLLSVMLMILFVGGSIASVKIGGGNNLHNLEAYLLMLMLWGSYSFTGRIKTEKTEASLHPRTMRTLLLFIFLPTAFWSILSIRTFPPANIPALDAELVQVNDFLQDANAEGKKILLINNRHLLAFDLIDPIPLLPEYELEELTEIAISGDAFRAEEFRQSLVRREYDLILTGRENDALQDDDRPFAAENNAWVRTVSARLLNQYELVLSLPESGIEIYAPKP